MDLEITETAETVVYNDTVTGAVITVKKDDNFLDVHQVVPIAFAGGETWQKLKTYLEAKRLES